tara:strand:+ start:474 stop:704 length:231 start_codon:yes stop_codon:yes gene_type:complete
MSKYIARKNFKFSGRLFATGDKFNCKRMACNQRKVNTLIASGFIEEVVSVKVVEPVREEPVIEELVEEESVMEDYM